MVSNGIVHNNQIRFKTANKRIMKDFLSSVASFSDQIEELEHEAILIRTGEINTARAFRIPWPDVDWQQTKVHTSTSFLSVKR